MKFHKKYLSVCLVINWCANLTSCMPREFQTFLRYSFFSIFWPLLRSFNYPHFSLSISRRFVVARTKNQSQNVSLKTEIKFTHDTKKTTPTVWISYPLCVYKHFFPIIYSGITTEGVPGCIISLSLDLFCFVVFL